MSGQNLREDVAVTCPVCGRPGDCCRGRDHYRATVEDVLGICNDISVHSDQQAVDLIADLAEKALEGPADA